MNKLITFQFNNLLSFEFLFNLFVKSSIVILLVILLLEIFRKLSPSLKHWIWKLTIIIILVFPCVSTDLSIKKFPWLPSNNVSITTSKTPENTSIKSNNETSSNIQDPLSSTLNEKMDKKNSKSFSEIMEILHGYSQEFSIGLLIILVSGLFIIHMTYTIVRLNRIYSGSAPLCDDRWRIPFELLLVRWNIKSKVRLKVSNQVVVPSVFGVFNPIICIPESVLNWDTDEIELVLKHELVHILRFDFLFNILSNVVFSFYWWNPLVWLAKSRYQIESEKACDESVITKGVSPSAYANFLLKVSKFLNYERTKNVPGITGFNRLKVRLLSILQFKPRKRRYLLWLYIVSGLFAFLVFLVITSVNITHENKEILNGSLAELNKNTTVETIKLLHSANPDTKVKAAWKLGELEDPEAVNDLIKCLSDDDPQVRSMAAWALGEIKDRKALDPLLVTLKEENDLTKEMIIKAIGELESSKAIEYLLKELNHPNPDIRFAVVWSLGEIKTPNALFAVKKSLEDPNDKVKIIAIKVIENTGYKDATKSLINLMNHQNMDVRIQAINAVGRFRAHSAVQTLMGLLKDDNYLIRKEAVRAIGRIGDPIVVDSLLDLLRDAEPEVRDMAVWALDELKI